jgi:superoxide dismutase, Cu-Zn family
MNKGIAFAAAAVIATVAPLGACTKTNQGGSQPTTSPPNGVETMTTQLKSADGTLAANATFEFANGYATVTVEAGPNQVLTPGFHGLHIHSVGKCEANSVAPTGGAAGDFNSAGGHYQAPGHTGHPASGDLTSLEVRPDGSAKLVTTTSAFTAADLRSSAGSALIIHQDPDNFGNIPSTRYNQKDGVPGPDEQTMATGDAGKRVACGVLAPDVATPTVTTTAVQPPPKSTVTATLIPPSATATLIPPTSTATLVPTSQPKPTLNLPPGR